MGPVGQKVLESLLHALSGTELWDLADEATRAKLGPACRETLHFSGCHAPLIFTGLGRADWSCFTELRYYRPDSGLLVALGPAHIAGKLSLPGFEMEPEVFSL